MEIVHSDDNRLHFPQGELFGGELVTPFERPSRVEFILNELKRRGHRDINAPGAFSAKPVRTVHDAKYLKFLQTAWDQWIEAGYKGEILPTVIPARRMRQIEPRHIDGKVGYYALAIETAMTPGTWQAAKASCAVAQTAQRLVSKGDDAAFALCRPPGHHAARDLYGGYCFLNNAAVAAQMFLDDGAKRVAILDVDFHHGNGTQDIFYDRDDVLFCSLHGRPEDAFPHFLGYKDETGSGCSRKTPRCLKRECAAGPVSLLPNARLASGYGDTCAVPSTFGFDRICRTKLLYRSSSCVIE